MKLFRTFRKHQTCTLAFYMRSGNVVRAYGVTHWKLHHTDNNITGLTIERGNGPDDGLIVKSIALDQIEAVAREPSA